MGIIRQGILGGFRKKTGSVVGAHWRTLDVIRGLPRKSGKAPTKLQKDQQSKFGLVTGFLSWIGDLVEMGYKSQSGIATAMNSAVAYNLKEALTDTGTGIELNYPKISFSSGRLRLPDDLKAVAVTGAKIDYSWSHLEKDDKFLNARDSANILVYNPVKGKLVKSKEAETRSVGAFSLQLPANFTGDQVHCYISFNSAVQKALASETFYAGKLTVI